MERYGRCRLASAAIEDIRIAFPEAEIDLNTLPPWHQLYQSDPRFTYVHSYPLRAKELRERFGASIHWLKTVAARRYDLVIDLQTTDRSRLMIGLLPLFGGGVRYRAGNKPAWPYNLAPQYTGGARHALDLARDTMGAAGIEGATKVPILHYDAQERAEADALMVARTLEKIILQSYFLVAKLEVGSSDGAQKTMQIVRAAFFRLTSNRL